ncbi:MAG: antirestriction protein ArdA [Gammaproteobacteria bacterium]
MSNLLPKIYVICTAASDAGVRHGAWINAYQDVEEIEADVQCMLASSPFPESEGYDIYDSLDFGELEILTCESLKNVSEWAKFIVKHGRLGSKVIDYVGGNLEEATRMMEECYYGTYSSESAFVESIFEQATDIPAHLQNYIDYQAMARDWFISDFVSLKLKHKHEVHVFSQY